MKRFPRIAFLLAAALVCPALAQESQKQESQKEGEGSQEIWLIANFVILVAGLGVLIGKNAGPFFRARAHKIREEIVRGEDARQDAEKRADDVDRRLANLDAEIAGLRADSQREIEIQMGRMRERTATEHARILAQSQQEIVAAGKTARAELKRYSAELAIGLAERKIRARMNPEIQDSLIGSFVENLNAPPPGDAPSALA
jgi:F-type H+-transporting ATPase subunit b